MTTNTSTIQSIDYEGRGIARINGKTTFIRNALPLETVVHRITRQKKQFDEAETIQILTPSNVRTQATCVHYGDCGGCALQHARFDAQVAFKQRIFEEQLQRIGKLYPEQLLPPIYGQPWHYRQRTRLSVLIDQNQKILLGYQAKNSHRIIHITQCPVLPKHISEKLPEIHTLIQKLHQIAPQNPVQAVQIHNSPQSTALTLHSQQKLPQQTHAIFRQLFEEHWHLWTQYDKHPPQAQNTSDEEKLFYRLAEFDLTMPYRPGDFTQINADLNELMISRAVRMLEPQDNEIIADLFCGLGNFSLPLAKRSHKVLGIEGSNTLTQRAQNNAKFNGLHNIHFSCSDLFDTTEQTVRQWGKIDKMLLDPPRAGAYAVVQALHAPFLPKRIVYVSCNPGTFARDAAVLLSKGYRLHSAGIMNMFPQTAHVESIARFDLNQEN